MIYLDSSALVKLVLEEEHSDALQRWLDERPDEQHVTSALARAELLRAVRRNNDSEAGGPSDADGLEAELSEAAEVLGSVMQLAVDDAVLDRAAGFTAPQLPSAAAIHLSSAAEFDASGVVLVTYDQALVAAAREAELAVVTPGDQERDIDQPAP